ncbi:hypothetical protein OVY01_21610 [Robbsia sp. Bb-Pol-6]|uniref:Uncharacterized protein n=1 Tax=Robbsia betulipollinis TaxID=2981849 RepID=A0ABT3ZT66_9BURK|nr:hypothetical protein [Robbsia betulipollinis]MCY0389743.1 hypothetical protein [Robbsia betulipollinis]
MGRAVCVIGDDDGCDLLLGPPRSRAEGSRYASLRADAHGVWLARPDAADAAAAEMRLHPGDDFEVAGVRCRITCEDGDGTPDDSASTGAAVSVSDPPGQDEGGAAHGDGSGDGSGSGNGSGNGSLARDAAEFVHALDRAGAAHAESAPAGESCARRALPREADAGRPTGARLRRRAALSTLVLSAGLLIAGALTDGPLFAMQGRDAAPAASGAVRTRQSVDAVHVQLARAGVARWVGVAGKGDAPQLVVFADVPAHESTIRRALSNAGVALPVQVMSESAVLAQVNAFLQGDHAAARPRGRRLRAVGAGPGRIRIVGLVDSRADAAAVLASLRDRFPALKAIECDLASDADARQTVLPLLREPLPETPSPESAARLVAAPERALAEDAFGETGAGMHLLIDAAPATLAVLEQRVAAAAVAQNQVLAIALRDPAAASRHAPAPRMIVMGARPYAVLANGVTVFEGDALGDRIVARIERDAIRLLPPSGGST